MADDGKDLEAIQGTAPETPPEAGEYTYAALDAQTDLVDALTAEVADLRHRAKTDPSLKEELAEKRARLKQERKKEYDIFKNVDPFVKRDHFKVSWSEVKEAFLGIFGESEEQKKNEILDELAEQEENKRKFYTYDDIPAPGDGEPDPVTGIKRIMRIPHHTVPRWKKIVVVSVAAVSALVSMYTGLKVLPVYQVKYEVRENGAYMKRFAAGGDVTELVLDTGDIPTGEKHWVKGELKLGQRMDGSASLVIPYPAYVDVTRTEPLVGLAAFSCANLQYVTKVQIGAGITDIEEFAFHNNMYVTEYNVDPDNPNYASVDGVLFSKDMTRLIQYPINKSDEVYTVPATVKRIEDNAFYSPGYSNSWWQPHLQVVVLPEGLEYMGEAAFFGQKKLVKINIPSTLLYMGKDAFSYCSSLPTRFYVPKNVRVFGSYMFFTATQVRDIYFERTKAQVSVENENEFRIQDDGTIAVGYQTDIKSSLKGLFSLKSQASLHDENSLPVKVVAADKTVIGRLNRVPEDKNGDGSDDFFSLAHPTLHYGFTQDQFHALLSEEEQKLEAISAAKYAHNLQVQHLTETVGSMRSWRDSYQISDADYAVLLDPAADNAAVAAALEKYLLPPQVTKDLTEQEKADALAAELAKVTPEEIAKEKADRRAEGKRVNDKEAANNIANRRINDLNAIASVHESLQDYAAKLGRDEYNTVVEGAKNG